MSRGSYFTIYKLYKKFPVAQDKLDQFKRIYAENNRECDFSENRPDVTDEKYQDFPNILDWHLSESIPESQMTLADHRDRYISLDGFPADEIAEEHFNSVLTALPKYFNLGCTNKFSDCETLITPDVAKSMLQAIRYLTSEHYDKRFEDILDNKWISVFAEHYPKYAYRDSSKSELNEILAEDESWKYILPRIKTFLEMFVWFVEENESWCTNDKYEYRLVYRYYF